MSLSRNITPIPDYIYGPLSPSKRSFIARNISSDFDVDFDGVMSTNRRINIPLKSPREISVVTIYALG